MLLFYNQRLLLYLSVCKMGLLSQLVLLFIVLAAVYLAYTYIPTGPQQLQQVLNSTGAGRNGVSFPSTTTIKQESVPQNQTYAYALSVINKDRAQFGLANVSISNITSGQQHADSMMQHAYFSHWDTYGMKPYMRYTLVGGRGAVDENVAFIYNSSGINVLEAIKEMEYSMMYNDSACCNNGHRDNILTPSHNQVSIGVAYNATTIYFVEDFINNYITWFYGTPSYGGGNVSLAGSISGGYNLTQVEISYDQPVHNMTRAQLNATRSYSYGSTVAGIGYTVGRSTYYFPNLTTINASTYTLQGSDFDVKFGMGGLVSKYGAGEYTIMLWLSNATSGDFIGSTYTIFINSSGEQYIPADV